MHGREADAQRIESAVADEFEDFVAGDSRRNTGFDEKAGGILAQEREFSDRQTVGGVFGEKLDSIATFRDRSSESATAKRLVESAGTTDTGGSVERNSDADDRAAITTNFEVSRRCAC